MLCLFVWLYDQWAAAKMGLLILILGYISSSLVVQLAARVGTLASFARLGARHEAGKNGR